MISCRLEAGMGNQLFIIAFIYSYAKKHGFDYCIPTSVTNSHISGRGAYILPGISYSNDYVGKLEVFRENSFPNHFMYQEFPVRDNIIFEGFFQSAKYFNEYREEILKAFGFKWQLKEGYCSVHIRIGDYLQLKDYHPVVSKEYLFEAMTKAAAYYNGDGSIDFIQGIEPLKFLVFSDSIERAKEILSSPEFNLFKIEYSEGRNEIEDLELASGCPINIGSNSTYSWWIYYLNKNTDKQGVFPRNWFGPLLKHDTKDLYLPNSIIL